MKFAQEAIQNAIEAARKIRYAENLNNREQIEAALDTARRKLGNILKLEDDGTMPTEIADVIGVVQEAEGKLYN